MTLSSLVHLGLTIIEKSNEEISARKVYFGRKENIKLDLING